MVNLHKVFFTVICAYVRRVVDICICVVSLYSKHIGQLAIWKIYLSIVIWKYICHCAL